MSQAKKKQWLQKHLGDSYVKQAQAEGYRSRAAFKIQEVLDKHNIVHAGDRVVELGSAPGAWTQVLVKYLKGGQLIACDLLPMDAVDGVTFIQGDFLSNQTQAEIHTALAGKCVLVVSDMAPNLTGSDITDQANMEYLVDAILHFCQSNLAQDGRLFLKLFKCRNKLHQCGSI